MIISFVSQPDKSEEAGEMKIHFNWPIPVSIGPRYRSCRRRCLRCPQHSTDSTDPELPVPDSINGPILSDMNRAQFCAKTEPEKTQPNMLRSKDFCNLICRNYSSEMNR